MGPGKQRGIITISLEKNGEEMTVKAPLLQRLTATKGHHHGCGESRVSVAEEPRPL